MESVGTGWLHHQILAGWASHTCANQEGHVAGDGKLLLELNRIWRCGSGDTLRLPTAVAPLLETNREVEFNPAWGEVTSNVCVELGAHATLMGMESTVPSMDTSRPGK